MIESFNNVANNYADSNEKKDTTISSWLLFLEKEIFDDKPDAEQIRIFFQETFWQGFFETEKEDRYVLLEETKLSLSALQEIYTVSFAIHPWYIKSFLSNWKYDTLQFVSFIKKIYSIKWWRTTKPLTQERKDYLSLLNEDQLLMEQAMTDSLALDVFDLSGYSQEMDRVLLACYDNQSLLELLPWLDIGFVPVGDVRRGTETTISLKTLTAIATWKWSDIFFMKHFLPSSRLHLSPYREIMDDKKKRDALFTVLVKEADQYFFSYLADRWTYMMENGTQEEKNFYEVLLKKILPLETREKLKARDDTLFLGHCFMMEWYFGKEDNMCRLGKTWATMDTLDSYVSDIISDKNIRRAEKFLYRKKHIVIDAWINELAGWEQANNIIYRLLIIMKKISDFAKSTWQEEPIFHIINVTPFWGHNGSWNEAHEKLQNDQRESYNKQLQQLTENPDYNNIRIIDMASIVADPKDPSRLAANYAWNGDKLHMTMSAYGLFLLEIEKSLDRE